MKVDKSLALWEEGKKYMANGIAASGRLHAATGRPLYIERMEGSKMYTVDGETLIDYHLGSGAAMFGHKHPRIEAALKECIENGFFMNFDSPKTIEFAKNFTTLVPTVEKFRTLNSGSEATSAALRIARAYTGRKLVVRIDGHFHGMHETVYFNHNNYPEMDKYGEVTTLADTGGIPDEFASLVKVVRWNDIDALEHVVEKYKGQIAAIMFEPVCFNVGCSPAKPEYVKAIRKLCDDEGILMFMDEVITGVRFRPGSAAGYYGVKPDITTFAKAIGGGMQIALVGGTNEVMEMCGANAKVGVSGTYSGNQLGIWGANECIKMALEPGFYDDIEAKGNKLIGGMNDLMKKHGLVGHAVNLGARFAIYWGYEDPEIDMDLRKSQQLFRRDLANAFITGCLDNGLYFHSYWNANIPSHCGFSVQHTMEDIDYTLDRMDSIMAGMKSLR